MYQVAIRKGKRTSRYEVLDCDGVMFSLQAFIEEYGEPDSISAVLIQQIRSDVNKEISQRSDDY